MSAARKLAGYKCNQRYLKTMRGDINKVYEANIYRGKWGRKIEVRRLQSRTERRSESA